LMPQYLRKTKLFSLSYIFLLFYTSILNIQSTNSNVHFLVKYNNIIIFINACYMIRSICPSSGKGVENLKKKKMA
jgi:hypothetical protein